MLILRASMQKARTRDACLKKPRPTVRFSPRVDITSGSVSKCSEVVYTQTSGWTREGNDNMA